MTTKEIETRLINLENAFVEAQKRNVNNTYRSEDAISKIDTITPTTDSKQAYIGDTEVIFDNVKEGNVSVFATTESGKVINTITDKMGNSIRVSFDALEEVATITISVL